MTLSAEIISLPSWRAALQADRDSLNATMRRFCEMQQFLKLLGLEIKWKNLNEPYEVVFAPSDPSETIKWGVD